MHSQSSVCFGPGDYCRLAILEVGHFQESKVVSKKPQPESGMEVDCLVGFATPDDVGSCAGKAAFDRESLQETHLSARMDTLSEVLA